MGTVTSGTVSSCHGLRPGTAAKPERSVHTNEGGEGCSYYYHFLSRTKERYFLLKLDLHDICTISLSRCFPQAHLASVHSQAESDFLASRLMPQDRGEFWLDGRRMFQEYTEPFGWTDGTSFDFKQFCESDIPNLTPIWRSRLGGLGGPEAEGDCLKVCGCNYDVTGTHCWTKTDCSIRLPSVCKKSPVKLC